MDSNMQKKPFNLLKIGVIGFAMLMGASGAAFSAPAEAWAEATPTVIAAPSSPVVAAGVTIKEESLTTASQNLQADIKVPQLSDMLDTKYQEEVNALILSHARRDLIQWEIEADEWAAEAKADGLPFRPYLLVITSSLKSDGTGNPAGVVSLVVTTYGSRGNTGMPRVDTYNILNSARAQRVTLADLLGDSYQETINAGVTAEIQKNPQIYFPDDFKGIDNEQAFYVEKGEAVVVFQKYSIAPGSTGTPEFRFKLADNLTVKPSSTTGLDLQPDDTFTSETGIMMVPLRRVAEAMGYEVKWHQEASSVEVNKGAQWTSVAIGRDLYYLGKMAPVSLGAAPVIKNDTCYVPVNFVAEILRADIVFNDGGIIHIEQK